MIIGGGCAGLTAAIYAARANLSPVVIEGFEPMGQLALTTEVENYPGFPDGVLGPDIMTKFRSQAERFGARFVTSNATGADLGRSPFAIEVGPEHRFEARSVIVATGANPRMLGIPGEREFLGMGVSTCATCDGFFFSDLPIVVVGGGDSALEEALFLTRFASTVTVVHRREFLRASKIMQDRAVSNRKITFVWDTVVEEVCGAESVVESVRLRNVKTGQLSGLPTSAMFVAIGHDPNSALFRGQLDLNEAGYVKVRYPLTETSVPGVFACGDVVDHRYRQAVTAAGTGCAAAIDAERFLETEGV